MKVGALVDNLFFKSKIMAAAKQSGCEVVFGHDAEAVPADAQRVIIDLDATGFDAVKQVSLLRKARTVPIVAFCQHTHTTSRKAAEKAGADEVMSRSDFVNRMGQLLST
jgi:DNA-binding response OmpR family regulator